MQYQQIKQKRSDDTNKLFTDLGVFWAFSNEQFDKGYKKAKATMAEGEKLVSIGAGGYIPKNNIDALTGGMKAIKKEFKNAIKENKARETHILYELNNHECFYTGRIQDAIDALGEEYTETEVTEVYKKFKAKKYVSKLSALEQQQKYEQI